jgi:hypothetical protein
VGETPPGSIPFVVVCRFFIAPLQRTYQSYGLLGAWTAASIRVHNNFGWQLEQSLYVTFKHLWILASPANSSNPFRPTCLSLMVLRSTME